MGSAAIPSRRGEHQSSLCEVGIAPKDATNRIGRLATDRSIILDRAALAWAKRGMGLLSVVVALAMRKSVGGGTQIFHHMKNEI